MTGPKGSAVITREDVERAQAVIDAWRFDWVNVDKIPTQELAFLRGLITTAIADAQVRGYDQGVARGRRLIAHTILDALDGEGLFTTNTRQADGL